MPIKKIHKDEIERMVNQILSEISPKGQWPKNVTEEVFVTIENSYRHTNNYNNLIKADGKDTINQEIGRVVKDMTRLETIREQVPATKTNLISYYTELG